MTIWIHIGLVKTGTTTIQNFLATNYRKLLQHGYLYPIGRPGGPSYHAHFFLAHELRGLEKFDSTRGSWADITDWKRNNPESSVIISAESFQHLSGSPKQVAAMRDKLAGLDVRIVVYLRQQCQLAESWYMQKLKTGRTDVPFAEFIGRRDNSLMFSQLLKPWEVFGGENIVVRVFERSQMVNGDLLDDFCSVVGLPLPSQDPGYEHLKNRNESPGPMSLALSEMFYRNQMMDRDAASAHASEDIEEEEQAPVMTAEERRVLKKAIKRAKAEGGGQIASISAPAAPKVKPLTIKDGRLLEVANRIWPNQDKARLMSGQQQRAFMAGYAEDNALVVKRYLPRRTTALFSDAPADLQPNYTTYDEVLKGASSAELVEAFSYLLGVIGRRRKALQITSKLR